MERYLFIALGGALGAVLRVLLVDAVGAWLGREFPYGTLAVNVLGSFGIGVLAALMLGEAPSLDARWVPLLIPGLLGGFTTFSAYSLEAVALVQDGRTGEAALYALGSVLLGLAAAALGMVAARAL